MTLFWFLVLSSSSFFKQKLLPLTSCSGAERSLKGRKKCLFFGSVLSHAIVCELPSNHKNEMAKKKHIKKLSRVLFRSILRTILILRQN